MKKIQRLAENLGAKFTPETRGDPVFYIDAPEGYIFAATRETSLVYGFDNYPDETRADTIRAAVNDLQQGLIPA
jgi:hypothetical protein